jgi:hypothetical protein
MKSIWRKRAIAAAAAATLGTYSVAGADTLLSSFTPGDLVVLRGGDAANQAGGATTTIGAYLDEFTPNGSYVGTIDVPQSAVGANNPLTVFNGPGSHEGILTLSANGNWLTFGGYDTAPTTNVSGPNASNGTVGEISQNASTLNTSTLENPTVMRAVVTVDGNEFWVSHAPGLNYINGTGASAVDTVLSGGYNTRALQTVNNTLIIGTGSSSVGTHGVWQMGSSGTLPTSGQPSGTLLTSGTPEDGTDFVFANEPGDTLSSSLYQGLYNVLYSVGGPSGGQTINKYEYNGSSFVLLNSESPIVGGGDTLIGVTAMVSGNNVDLYYSDNSGVYRIIDSNNANSLLPNNGSAFAPAPSGEYFYGVALAPTAIAGNSGLTWTDAAANGLWDKSSSNWNNGSSNATYADASAVTFNDNNGGNYSVTLNTAVSPSSISVNNSLGDYTISGAGSIAGSASLTKSGSGKISIGTSGSTLGAVTITAGTVKLAASTGGTTMTSLATSGNGTLDINNNHVIINYGTGPDPIASIMALLNAGFNGGAWNGLGGIDSSAVAGNSGYSIGYADSADPGNPAGLASGTIEISFTLLGDTNLDHAVNGVDFGILAANFNKGITGWDRGDFNYDNAVNGVDFGELAANFNKGAASASDIAALDAFAAANGLMADVPEPVAIGLLGFGTVALLARRRKRNDKQKREELIHA